jgi:hypothetical protein
MRALFVPMLVAHVMVAVLGLGSVVSVAVIAATARRTGRAASDVSAWLGPLLRSSAFSLVAMVLTGGLMDLAAGGAFSARWWFRGSALLVIATGILHAQARRALRAPLPNDDRGDGVLRRVEWTAYGMSALVAIVTVLMEVKPF